MCTRVCGHTHTQTRRNEVVGVWALPGEATFRVCILAAPGYLVTSLSTCLHHLVLGVNGVDVALESSRSLSTP